MEEFRVLAGARKPDVVSHDVLATLCPSNVRRQLAAAGEGRGPCCSSIGCLLDAWRAGGVAFGLPVGCVVGRGSVAIVKPPESALGFGELARRFVVFVPI